MSHWPPSRRCKRLPRVLGHRRSVRSAIAAELVYRYARPSTVDASGMRLVTSGESAVAEPYFRGFVERPDQGAAALLCVARVARTRFYVPPGSAARGDRHPVVTSEPGALRFRASAPAAACTRASTSRPRGSTPSR